MKVAKPQPLSEGVLSKPCLVTLVSKGSHKKINQARLLIACSNQEGQIGCDLLGVELVTLSVAPGVHLFLISAKTS